MHIVVSIYSSPPAVSSWCELHGRSLDALDPGHDLPLVHGQRVSVAAHLLLYDRVVEVRALRLEEVSVGNENKYKTGSMIVR